MSTKAKQETRLVDLVLSTYEDWSKVGYLPDNEKSSFEDAMQLLYGLTGQMLGKFADLVKTQHQVEGITPFTIEGNISEIASSQLDPKLPTKIRHSILHKSPIIGTSDLSTHALVDFLPDSHPPDADILLQYLSIENFINISETFFDTNNVLSRDDGYSIHKLLIPINENCNLLRIELRLHNQPVHHIDISRNPDNPKVRSSDNRTDWEERSLHSIYQNPLFVNEKGELIVGENRRQSRLEDPETAHGIGQEKGPIQTTELGIRDMRKAVAAQVSRNTSRTPINKLSSNKKFLTQDVIKRIKRISRKMFESLPDFFRTSWMKETMLIATLDPFLAIWWLNTTHMDTHILGHHFNNIDPILSKLSLLIANDADVETSRNTYHLLKEFNGWQMLIKAIEIYARENRIRLHKPMIIFNNKPNSSSALQPPNGLNHHSPAH